MKEKETMGGGEGGAGVSNEVCNKLVRLVINFVTRSL
jgi:hypothetical protein